MSLPVMIEVKDLRKEFILNTNGAASLKTAILWWKRGEKVSRKVLNGLTFSIKKGESVAIVGRNGAGKSTLLSIIAKVYQASGGECNVHGKVAPLLELGAGFHPDLSGRSNLRMNALFMGLSLKQIEEREEQMIEFSGLAEYIDEPTRKYSSGMVARLGFAVVAHCDPDILIVDEVLSVGDFKFREKCKAFLDQFVADGGTLLFVSHETDQVTTQARRVIWIENGLVRADGPSAEVSEQYLAEASAPTA